MKSLKTLPLLLLAALAAAGCGDKAEDKKPASQVAAKVNSGEISVHQINHVLQRTPGIKAEQVEQARKRVLEGLIDQELAVQQAIEAKLDRNPDVLQAMEAAKREVLARAYMEQQVAARSKPAPEEVRKYFNDHPDLFSARKIYRLEEVGFAASPEVVAGVQDLVANAKNMNEVVAALKAKGIEPTGGAAVKPAEQIPLDLLPRLAQQKEGQPQLYAGGGKAAIINVVATKPEPLTEAQATPVIEQFLANQSRNELARDHIKQLREKARIEYVGEFAAAKPQDDAVINKGIAGLK